MKKNSFLILVFLVALITSCSAPKNVAYLHNSDDVDLSQSLYLYDAKIMPKDILTITVNTVNPEAASPFNLTVPTNFNNQTRYTYSQPILQTYLVDNEGTIDYPVLGRIKVGGLTKSECEAMIHDKIKPYLNAAENPVVTVQMSSYSISVLGEVNRPGSFQVSREKINILEALAQAGDLTIYGVREDVKLIREDAKGKKQIYHINLNDANLLTSPYYYLQQNDIVYVEPNKVKARNSSIGQSTTLWISATSILVSIAALVVNILK